MIAVDLDVCCVCSTAHPSLTCDRCARPMCDTAACAERRAEMIWCIACVDAEPSNVERLAELRTQLAEARNDVARLGAELEDAHGEVYDLEESLKRLEASHD